MAAAAAWPVGARAEEKARLVYVRGNGAEDCPAEMDLRLLVIARLGYDPFSPHASRVVISRVEARGERLVSTLEVIDQGGRSTGQRELGAAPGRCGELARAMALSISLAIDPDRANQSPTAAPANPPQDALATPEEDEGAGLASQPTSPRPTDPVRAPAEPPSRGPRAFAALALASSVGALPGLSLGGAASFGARLPSLVVSLDALGQMALPRELEPRGHLGGALLGGGISLCAVRGGWETCAVGRAGAQRLAASEVDRPGGSYGPFFGVGPRVAWVVPLGDRLAFTAGLEVLLHLTRNSAQLSERQVWRTPLVSGTLQLGVRALFL